MKKPIYYFLIIIFSIISLTSHAVSTDKKTENAANQIIHTIDINKADVGTLALLKGVGEKKAQAIVSYRELHGNFSSIEGLLNVKGIGRKILKLNKNKIKLE